MVTKKCNTCESVKDISSFGKNKRNKDGIENMCKECIKEKRKLNKESNAIAQKKWREKNPEYMKKYNKSEKRKVYEKQYYEQNKQNYIDRKKEWRKQNPEKEKQARNTYREENREKLNEYHRKWKENKRNKDVKYKLQSNMSRRIRYELNTLLKGKKTKRTTEYIGCSIEDLKGHLESKFTEGITWENYGSVWHIDHKIPCSSWNFENDFENHCCWNYRNLTPLLASVNQSKNNKYNEEDKKKYVEEMKLVLREFA